MTELVNVYDDVTGDWEAWYIDGELIAQGHRVEVAEVLHALDHKAKYLAASAEDTGDRFPNKLHDVVSIEARRARELRERAERLRAEADELLAEADRTEGEA